MKKIALTRMNILSLSKGEGLDASRKLTFQTELAKMGYRISNPQMLDQVSDAFFLDYQHLMDALALKRGGKVKYVPLFQNFPNDIPNDARYFMKRILGYLYNRLNLFNKGTRLNNGQIIPNWLFNLEEFGADPISQMQTKELFEAAVEQNKHKKGDTNTEWIDLKIAFDDELSELLKDYMCSLLYSKSSIKEALHTDLNSMLAFFGAADIDPDQLVFKETKSMVMKYFWQQGDLKAVSKLAHSPTDVLRMFAAVTETDVSLSDKIRFPKLSRKKRKCVLGILNKSSALAEELKKYKDLWLEIGRYLHPFEYAKAFPLAFQAFDALRNGRIETFASKTEQLLLNRELKALIAHLQAKPGIFARKLHEVLRTFPKQSDAIMDSFEPVVAKMALKNLLVMQAYFSNINHAKYRTVINKKGKVIVLENNAQGALSKPVLHLLNGILEQGIYTALAKKGSWQGKRVWIDPLLSNYTLPLQQRKASDGIITVGRGTRIPVNFSKVLRLFVYWKETAKTTDLDLSVMQFDENFDYLGHVSYTNLQADGIVHSGDLQSAPLGAVEFVDISLNKVDQKVKYLAVQVYKYCGENFLEMDCHAGWMLREKVDKSLKSFDIKTVVNKFDLNGKGAYAIPMVVDLANREMILTDLFVGGRSLHNNVEGSVTNVSLVCSQLANFIRTRPVISDLAERHVLARSATLVSDKALADITFGVTGCTYNGTDVAQILTELI